MSWAGFQEQIFTLTRKDSEGMIRQVMAEYDSAIESINNRLEKQFAKMSGVAPENYYNEMLKHNRLKNLLSATTADYNNYSAAAAKWQGNIQELSMSNAYYRKSYVLNWLSRYNTPVLPPSLLELSVYGTEDAWRNITESVVKRYGAKGIYQPQAGTLSNLLYNNRVEEINQIRRTITQGLVNRDSYRQMAGKIETIIGKAVKVDGKNALTGAKAKAMRIARTEGTRNMNAGAYASSRYAESQGVGIEKQWMAAFRNSRETHIGADGQRRGIDEPFSVGGETSQYPGNFASAKNNANCQCTYIDIVDGESPELRRGINPVTGKSEVFSFKDFDKYVKNSGLRIDKNGVVRAVK